ncbi:hypothetical protein Bca101_059531 [Brassica carinata]
MSFDCFYYPTDENPFVSSDTFSEELRKIHGDPIFDVYDEDLIQIEDGVDGDHVQVSVDEIGLYVVEDVQLEPTKDAHTDEVDYTIVMVSPKVNKMVLF